VHEEEILTGGVEAVLKHLADKGFTGAPATMGVLIRELHLSALTI
jgi:hypothetical protein